MVFFGAPEHLKKTSQLFDRVIDATNSQWLFNLKNNEEVLL